MTRAPVICSHSSARALAGHPRNVTDDMLLAIKANRGVVMVNFNCGFLSEEYDKLGQVARDTAGAWKLRRARDSKRIPTKLKEALEKLRVRYPAPAPTGHRHPDGPHLPHHQDCRHRLHRLGQRLRRRPVCSDRE